MGEGEGAGQTLQSVVEIKKDGEEGSLFRYSLKQPGLPGTPHSLSFLG